MSIRRPICLNCGLLVFWLILTSAAPGASAKRIVVFAPHPDDEALAASGIIYKGLASGDTVKIVVMTNGDFNGVDMGYTRQAETCTAMALLGVNEQDIIFLGYGDALLLDLYQSSSDTQIFTSQAGWTQTYGNRGLGGVDYHTFLFGAPGDYNRQTILGDIRAALTNLMPDEIYTTGFYDDHRDHKATYAFVAEALIALKRVGVALSPKVYESWIHAPCDHCDPNYRWPLPVFTPDQFFPQPPFLGTTPYRWSDIESIVVPAQMQDTNPNTNLKFQAIADYPSQTGGDLNHWLFAFVKKNEFFWIRDFATNLAVTASISVSSENTSSGQLGTKAVDAIIAGYPYAPAREWVTLGELAGAWIQLNWTAPVTLSRVVLYDRPNLTDQVLSGTLLFSDSSSVPVGTLPNNGSGLTVSFSPRTVTWMRFRVDTAAGTNIGLAEIEAFGTGGSGGGGGPDTNIAPRASVSVSSENASTTQLGIKAIDGIVDGWPGDYTKEWATLGELAGAWITLTWPGSVQISQVVLHDRPNLTDQVLAGTLLFSDGSTIPVGTLPNDGTGLSVSFPAKTATWVRFRVDNAVGANIGLAEIKLFGH